MTGIATVKLVREPFHPLESMTKILPLFTIFLFLNCSKLFNTDTDEGTISGQVTLEGMSDHSGITISLYEPIELDPDMVAINQEYPNIGVIISQRTEFDHRSHYPEFETTTEQNGNFSLENIPYNDYIIVYKKSGFGYHKTSTKGFKDGVAERACLYLKEKKDGIKRVDLFPSGGSEDTFG